MNNYLTFIFVLASFFGSTQSFEKADDPSQIKQILKKKTSTTNSISAEFSEIVYSSMFNNPKNASGIIKYQKSNNLRWEHLVPESKLLLINNGKLRMFEHGKEVQNAESNKIVKRIQNIMMQLFNGDFIESDDFIIGYYQSEQEYKLKLAPRSKRISKHMKYLELIFDKKLLSLQKLTLFDTEQDKVVYSFSSISFDNKLSDQLFTTP